MFTSSSADLHIAHPLRSQVHLSQIPPPPKASGTPVALPGEREDEKRGDAMKREDVMRREDGDEKWIGYCCTAGTTSLQQIQSTYIGRVRSKYCIIQSRAPPLSIENMNCIFLILENDTLNPQKSNHMIEV
jgi:hypothetical protein